MLRGVQRLKSADLYWSEAVLQLSVLTPLYAITGFSVKFNMTRHNKAYEPLTICAVSA